jgi:hypothetical protein
MNITTKNLSDLHAPARNVRRHTDKQIGEYVRSLKMFGQVRPIVCDESGEIIVGNGLYQAMFQMGAESCECYVITGLSDAQKKKLMLADNRVYELGITDTDAFQEIIKELEGDIDVPGWDESLLAVMNAATDDVDEIVKGYGAFEQGDVDRLASRPSSAEAFAAPAPDPAPTPTPAPASTPSVTLQAAPTEEPGQPERVDVQRVIICPKCGERICL